MFGQETFLFLFLNPAESLPAPDRFTTKPPFSQARQAMQTRFVVRSTNMRIKKKRNNKQTTNAEIDTTAVTDGSS